MDIDKLEAGRELDALVAEKVMGHKVVKLEHGGYYEEHPLTKEGFVSYPLCLYSTEMADAWKVLYQISLTRLGPEKHPAKDGRSALYKPVIRLEMYEHDDEYEVRIGRCKGVGMDDDIVVREIGGDFNRAIPLLICRAALRVVGS